MNKQIQDLLNELYLIDNSLREHESQLIKLIGEFMASRPNVNIDEDFKEELRIRIMNQIEQIKNQQTNQETSGRSRFFLPLSYALGGAIICAVIIVPILTANNSSSVDTNFTLNDSFTPQFEKLAANAFGDIISAPQDTASAPEASLSYRATGLGGGGGGSAMNLALSSVAADSKMIAPYYWNYKYVYNGEQVSLDESQRDVFKRINGKIGAGQLDQMLQNMKFSNLDLGTFSGTKLQSINLIQDNDFGYSINIDFSYGYMNIYENWEKWQSIYPQCQDEGCWERSKIKLSDIPSDEELVSMANKFLTDHAIDLSVYGAPEVDNTWRLNFDANINDYVPEVMSVVYPQIVNGNVVYDNGGGKAGVRVNINLRANKVSGMNNLFVQQYQTSSYEAETSWDRMLKYAANGGIYDRYYIQEEAGEEVIVELGTPEIIYTTTWNYNNGQSEELIIPALMFPVTNRDQLENYYGSNNIIIPLVKSLLDEADANKVDPTPRPLIEPLMMKAEDEAVTSEPAIEPLQ